MNKRSILKLAAIFFAASNAAVAAGTQVKPSSIPSSVPSIRPPTPEILEKCQTLIKEWALARGMAKEALSKCSLKVFHTQCVKTAEAHHKVLAPESPCAGVHQIQDAQLPELNCEIVQVPDSCSAL